MREQLHCAGQRADLIRPAYERVLVMLLDGFNLLGRDVATDFAEKRVHEQATAHADPPVDAPDCQLDSVCLERFPPREDVLVNTIDKRAVEVEQKCRDCHGSTGRASTKVLPFMCPLLSAQRSPPCRRAM